MIKIGNAPCSWGTLEFEGLEGETIGYSQMLDELVETGYHGTELGDWGYMPTDPSRLADEMAKRELSMLGAFVPVSLRDANSHKEGIERAVKTAALVASVAHVGDESTRQYLVLADDNGSDPLRTALAGRIEPHHALPLDERATFCKGADLIGKAVFEQTGLSTVFHHHGAGLIETPDEIAWLLDGTHPEHLGLVFDTGHYMLGGGEVMEGLSRFAGRIKYIHYKDFSKKIQKEAHAAEWNYFRQVAAGIFCELGQGDVPFEEVTRHLQETGYDGWIVVEQDVLPGMGLPRESARRNRQYLHSLGL